MTVTSDSPLGGFEQRLLGELLAVVQVRATEARIVSAAPSRSARNRRQRPIVRLSFAASGIAVVIACIVALIGLSSGSSPDLAQAFPVFARPSSVISRGALAQIVSQGGATLRNAGLDVQHARAFSTPLGTGYVISDAHADLICAAAPAFDKAWGASCGTVSQAKREGAGGIQAYGSVGEASYVAILPADATATIGRLGGPSRRLDMHDGVLAIVVHHPTVVRTLIAGHPQTTIIRPPFRSRHIPLRAPAQVVTPVRFRVIARHHFPQIIASFRTRYPARAGVIAYVLEYAPVPGTQPRCPGSQQPGDTIDEQTNRNILAGTVLTLRGGAPDCVGRWRVTVYLAASQGDVHYAGQVWAHPLNGAAIAPPRSGDQIVASKTIIIH
jgi:hypothetical protein